MSKRTITPGEQRTLRDKAKAELLRLEKIMNDSETVQMLDDFKNKFNLCETVYKVVLQERLYWKGKTPNGQLKVDMRQAPQTLSFAGYTFEKALLTELFGSKSAVGQNTVKKLRDAVTHGVDDKAVEEIRNRKEELDGYMDQFLETIRTADTKNKAA